MLYYQSCYKQEDYKCPELHQQVTNGRVSSAQHLTNKLRKGQLQVPSTSPTSYEKDSWKCKELHQQVTVDRKLHLHSTLLTNYKLERFLHSTLRTNIFFVFNQQFQYSFRDDFRRCSNTFCMLLRRERARPDPIPCGYLLAIFMHIKETFPANRLGEPRPSGAPSKRVMRRNERLCRRLGLRRCRYFQETQRRL